MRSKKRESSSNIPLNQGIKAAIHSMALGPQGCTHVYTREEEMVSAFSKCSFSA